jgi:hypothetical protein
MERRPRFAEIPDSGPSQVVEDTSAFPASAHCPQSGCRRGLRRYLEHPEVPVARSAPPGDRNTRPPGSRTCRAPRRRKPLGSCLLVNSTTTNGLTVLQRLDEVHAAEAAQHDEDDDGSGGLPAELRDRRRRLRKVQADGERPFAEIKQALRFRRWQLRGRANAGGEWNLLAAACNLRRLFALRVGHDAIARLLPLPRRQCCARPSGAAPAWLAAACRSRVPRTRRTHVLPRAKA